MPGRAAVRTPREIEFALDRDGGAGDVPPDACLWSDTQNRVAAATSITCQRPAWTRDTTTRRRRRLDPGAAGQGSPVRRHRGLPGQPARNGVNYVKITTVKGSWIDLRRRHAVRPGGSDARRAPAPLHLDSAEWLHDVLTRQGRRSCSRSCGSQSPTSGRPRRRAACFRRSRPDRHAADRAERRWKSFFPNPERLGRRQVQLFSSGQLAGRGDHGGPSALPPLHDLLPPALAHGHRLCLFAGESAGAAPAVSGRGAEANTPDRARLPADDRFRWNLESLVEVDDWLKKATPEQTAQFQTGGQNRQPGTERASTAMN